MAKKININTRSDNEWKELLARYWKIETISLESPFKVIAKFVKSPKRDVNNREYGYFEDVRNLDGDLLYYPMNMGKVRIFCPYKESFDNGEYWLVNVKLDAYIRREKHSNPFLLTLGDTIVGKPKLQLVDKLNKERLIHDIFTETGSTPRDAKNISNALHAIMGDLYTETERFVFELLQNADDQPKEGSLVYVNLKTLNETLLFLHSGKPFSEADVESISSIGDSTKKKDSEKTGYKGIGFKSVFSDAETVFINSGNFSFAFDKHSPVYSDTDNMDEIPWQIKPIWEEKYRLPKEVQNELQYFTSPVSIALQVGEEHVNNYNRIIPNLLSEPRFALFLRNIGCIKYSNEGGDVIEIKKEINDNVIIISSNDLEEKWVIQDYVIPIPPETSSEMQNEKLIPAKLKEATKTKITFAAKIKDGEIVPLENSVLFTYLPTKVGNFNFPFLVNADFLTTASRESIHFKNVWNRFLFSKIGELLVEWTETLTQFSNPLCMLPNIQNDEENILTSDFHKAYTKALSEKAFIKGHTGEILSLSQIMIDRSGLSSIIGNELFCEIVNDQKALPCDEKDADILYRLLESKVCEVDKYTPSNVLAKLIANTKFIAWFLAANEEKKSELYAWFVEKETDTRIPNIQSVIENLPIYNFGGKYLSKAEVILDTNKIVMRSGVESIRSVFEECGFECSVDMDSLPIAKFFTSHIISSTFDSIFNSLLQSPNFVSWLSNGTRCSHETLVNWLDEQYKPTLKAKFEGFVASLPLFHFSDKSMKLEDVESDKTRLIIDDNLESHKQLLSRIGFSCSANIDNSVFAKYIVKPKGVTVFENICERIQNVLKENLKSLSPNDKLEIFNILKSLDGVGDSKLSGLILFTNSINVYGKALKEMTSFDACLPDWLKEYEIHSSECFLDLQSYLVSKDRIFGDIVEPKIDSILNQTTLKDIYLQFKDSWTLRFTKEIIDDKGVTEATLDLVEQQNSESKRYFLQKVLKLELDVNRIYSASDFVYRLLTIAFEVYNSDELRLFASKIYIGERTLSSFTVSDDVEMAYHEGKVMHLSLSSILPDYQDSGMINKVKNSLSAFSTTDLECLLSLMPMSTKAIHEKIDTSNGYTAVQYLFELYRTRKLHNYYNGYVPNVDIVKAHENWVFDLFDTLYSQSVELYNDCFGYRLSPYFTNKYLSNDYILDKETILPSIEKWADTEEKRSYLVELGARTERGKLIQLRKSIIENNSITPAEVEAQKDYISETIELFNAKGLLPFKDETQIEAMLLFKPYYRYLSIVVNDSILKEASIEYDMQEYHSWKNDDSVSVYLYEDSMPKMLIKTDSDNLLICRFNEDDYYYNSSAKILYINKNNEPRDILYSVVSDSRVPFTARDWQQLFYDNLVTKDEVESKQKEINELKDQLEQYKMRFGELVSSTTLEEEPVQKTPSDEPEEGNIKDSPTAHIEGNSGSASKRDQYAAQLEAQQFLMQQRPDWSYPDGYGECDEQGRPMCFSTFTVKNEKAEYMPIVLKSYKSTGEPFKINPEEWESVAIDSAKLLVYTKLNSQLVIVEIPQEDLVKNQPNMTISFSTENLNSKEHEDRLSKFAETLHYFKELTFDFTCFHVSPNAIRVKDIFSKNGGVAVSATTDDL
ncbi:sacsin N-terminal ATP-binding-like domain-containing protein [Bacteroides uniformis]|jgi:hypothetical protein|uniref:Sacsin/Nov domain-containing protein n=1 Tax=Bacteroides uniformis TaxID=820 RepID=A0A3E4R8R5_BACUN|nr:hypothetical protein [Bacteroides uniformis]RGL16264.1 hypothetical protein DXC80_03580 [Bacteroides uniformis]